MEFNLLTKEQVSGNIFSQQLDIFKYHGIDAEVTNFSAFNGVKRNEGYGNYYLETSQIINRGKANIVDSHGLLSSYSLFSRHIGIRPVTYFSSLTLNNSFEFISDDIIICGEYPQARVNKKFANVLDNAEKTLTGKKYTILDRNCSPLSIKEYEYNGSKYVCTNNEFILKGQWFEVQPITWLIDQKKDLVVTEKILLGGIPYFINKRDAFKGKQCAKKYLDNYFAKEIYVSNDSVTEELLNQIEEIKKMREELGLYQLVLEHNISNHPNAIEPIETIKAQDNRLLEKQKEIQNKIDNYRSKLLMKRMS